MAVPATEPDTPERSAIARATLTAHGCHRPTWHEIPTRNPDLGIPLT
ncbi:MAG: hypothetical protein U0075_24705 [Thermomicrobiales bacterium]